MQYLLPNKVYDLIKYIVTIILPAASVLYVALAGIWGWPYADEISRTIAAVYTFLCALMGISSLTAKADPDKTADLGRRIPEV